MKRTQDPTQQRIERLRDSCSCNHHRKYSSLKLVLFLTETLLRGAGVSAHCPALLPEWNNAYSSLSTNSHNILLFSNSCQRETDKNRQQQQKCIRNANFVTHQPSARAAVQRVWFKSSRRCLQLSYSG